MNVASHPPVGIRRASGAADWPIAAVLLAEYDSHVQRELGIDLATVQPGSAHELADPAALYARRPGGLFLARRDGVAAGTVAVRCHADGRAELKRFYVRPAHRGSGVADALVAAAIAEAARSGCPSIWLETKRGAMDRAIAVYRRHGFHEANRDAGLRLAGAVVLERDVDIALGQAS